MSKRYNIRWSKSDNQELSKAVKNFNAKITRLEKKYPDKIKALPEKVKVSDLKELIETRQDLKRELNALRRFSRKGAEEFVKVPNNDNNLEITKWQKNEMLRRAGVINKRRKKKRKEISEIELASRGQKLGYTRGDLGMGNADEVALRPLNPFTKGMYYNDMHRKFKVIRKESQDRYYTKRDRQMVENYIVALIQNFNVNDVWAIVEKLESMSFPELYKIIMEEDPQFEYPYPLDYEGYQEALSTLRQTFIPDHELEWYENVSEEEKRQRVEEALQRRKEREEEKKRKKERARKKAKRGKKG